MLTQTRLSYWRLLATLVFVAASPATVAQANQAPIAHPDNDQTHNNRSILIDVLANDSDPDGDTITLIGPIEDEINPPFDHGLPVVEGQAIRYTPHADYVGTDTFRYRIHDGEHFRSAVVTIDVVANQRPNARLDPPSGSTLEVISGGSIAIDVLGNDDDPDGDTITLIGPIEDGNHPHDDHATITANNGTIEYAPHSGFEGTDTFRYRIHDGALFHSAVVTVQVTAAPPINLPPIARPDPGDGPPITTDWDTSIRITVLDNDEDPNLDPIQLVGPIEDENHPHDDHAVVSKEGNAIRYVPHAGFEGTDTFRYRIHDGEHFRSAVVTVQVTDPNAAPQIRITDPTGAPIAPAGNFVFAPASPGEARIATLALHNDGNAPLQLLNPGSIVSGSGFVLATAPTSPVAANDSTTFVVRFEAATTGAFSGAVDIASNASPSTFSFGLRAQVELGACSSGPGALRDALYRAVVGLPPTCRGADAYNPSFPTVYQNAAGIPKCGFNIPVLAGAYTFVTAPGQAGPHGGDVLDWWYEYLRGELGMRGGSWHFGGLELFSGIYEFNNELAVLAVRFHALEMASDPTVPSAQQARYATIARLAELWLRATFGLQAMASVPVPDAIYDPVGDTLRAAPMGNVFEGNHVPSRYIALSGMRFRDIAWVRQQRSMIFERAIGTNIRYSREEDAQELLLDHIEGANWSTLASHSGPYGLSSNEAEALEAVQGTGSLPSGFNLIGALSGAVDVSPFASGSQAWRITGALPYEIYGWQDGDRLSIMKGRGNSCKAPTPGMLYVATNHGPLGQPDLLYTLYPYPPGVKDPSGTPTVTVDLDAGEVRAQIGSTVDTLDNLPPTCALRYKIKLGAGAPTVETFPASCNGQPVTTCLPPSTDGLVGHWDFQGIALGFDSSGTGRHGVTHGTPQVVAGRDAGETALQLDGTSHVTIPNLGTDLDLASAVTVEAWVKTSLHTQPNVFRVRQPVALYSDRFLVANYVSGAGWYPVTTSSNPPLDTWYHLAGVFDHGTLRIYIDGVLAGETSLPVAETDGTSYGIWSLGGRVLGDGNADQGFVGMVDDVKVYTRALSSNEIAAAAGTCQ